MPEAVIVATARSPIGRAHKGSLKDVRAADLAASMVEAVLDKVPGLDPASIEDLMLGCARPEGEGGNNMARVVAVLAGLDDVPGTTLDRKCASSVQTTRMAAHAIRAGEGDVFLSVGVEAVSRGGQWSGAEGVTAENPRFDEARARMIRVIAGEQEWVDPRAEGHLPDIYVAMGQTAENVARVKGISRAAQDEFAVRSQHRAEAAKANGFWSREIVPVTLPDGTVLRDDDCPRAGTTLEVVSGLKPAFRPDGTVTAGNSCPLNDGAAAVLVMSDTRARDLGLAPLARIVSTGVSGLSPEIMGMGPVKATESALQRAGLGIGDIDLVEINEAFAAQVIASARELGIDEDRLNVNGGAIALGHPFGMTGARITSTLINALQFHDKQFGLVTMCVGGGQGMAMVLERL